MVDELAAVEAAGPQLRDLAARAGHGVLMAFHAGLRVVHRAEAVRLVLALFEGHAVQVELGLGGQSRS